MANSRYGLILIFFAGSVFSPIYAERLRRGEAANGLEHPAVNLALYERSGDAASRNLKRLWVMNEYPPSSLRVSGRRVAINQSFIEWAEDGSLFIEVHEETTRFFGKPGPRIDATMRIYWPASMPSFCPRVAPMELGHNEKGAAHFWQPLLAGGKVDVHLSSGPLALRYSGLAYCDRNYGSGPLSDTFRRWSWAHGFAAEEPAPASASASALVLYRAEHLSGAVTGLILRREDAWTATRCADDTASSEGRRDFLWLSVPSRFGVGTATCERPRGGRLEDAPFYARYVARLRDSQKDYFGVGEYLDLDRFRMPPVQKLLSFKTRLVPT